MNIPVEVRSFQTDETFPSHLKNEQIVLHLALKKALTAVKDLKEAELLITADTIVVYDEKVLNKPAGKDEAIHMLTMLSGKMHEVYTGVCISSTEKKKYFSTGAKCISENMVFRKFCFTLSITNHLTKQAPMVFRIGSGLPVSKKSTAVFIM